VRGFTLLFSRTEPAGIPVAKRLSMERFVCIHGHFYQPPRENPWLEAVELQDSAAPFHDWNERITAECYGRNTAARIFDGEARIDDIVNNYSKISFNFGPTLLTWMKDKSPWVHEAIVQADQQSRKKFSGHGSAMAQAYNHMILPLANDRDKETQVIWGIRDFESRFGRKPEGMWLAETAADTASLEVLATHGIKFTVLSPFQAREMRKIGDKEWQDANGAQIDPSRAYLMRLPSGKSISIFFYDAPVSQAVAFEKLLDSGEKFAGRLTSAFSDQRDWEQLVHIATDGESYGHHHRWGEMALAYALNYIESNKLARLTNYGEYLEKHPPTHEATIHEGSAWSCSHGVGRWKENCGCNSGGHGDWNQNWRGPLRMALDWLRDQLAPGFEKRARDYVKDPWAARNDYIQVILDRADENVEGFFERHAARELSPDDKVAVLKLMEMQRHAMLMYTSCGWFFDELSGLETVQVIQYAARAVQLAKDVLGADLEGGFLDLLQQAKSNIAEHGDGRAIYEKFVKPAMISWENAVAHYAISSVFTAYEQRTRIFLYSFEEVNRKTFESGKARLACGTTRVRFEITRESKVFNYAVIYLGEHHLTAAVQPFENEEGYNAMVAELGESFSRGEFPETIRLLDRHFGAQNYSLRSLFKDEQRRILNEILSSARQDLENRNRLIAERYTPLIHFLEDIRTPLPPALKSAVDFILHADIVNQFEAEETDTQRVLGLFDEAKRRNVNLPMDQIQHAMSTKMERLLERIEENPGELAPAEQAARVAGVIRTMPVDPHLWRARTKYWEMLKTVLPKFRDKAAKGDEQSSEWVKCFLKLGEELNFARRHLQVEG
jgi:alpha-amylase/alpha-mannosidase (GH57 family)